MAFAGIALLVLGFGLWAVYRLSVSSERHAFAAGAIAPTYVEVTAGKTYRIAAPGGVQRESDAGVDPSALRCSVTPQGAPAVQLAITPEQAGSKATDQVATFVAPVTGKVHIDCRGGSEVFVDDADDAAADRSGLWLVLATIMLAIGAPVTLSVLRRTPSGAEYTGDAASDAANDCVDER